MTFKSVAIPERHYMNIKQLVSISAVFVLLISARFVDFEPAKAGDKTQKGIIKTADSTLLAPSAEGPEYLAHSPYIANLHFANEYLPLGDKKVENRMQQHLKDYSFEQVRTHRMHNLAEKSLPLVEEILVSYGIPADFKYIPMVESGFSQNATSPKGASGYWQFMPATAVAFGLKVNEEVDERHDLIKSTHAAARYILALYKEFDSWVLTAAAYNVGSGSLRQSMAKQNEDNYFKLQLNRETSAYVYRLISAKEIIENPGRHGYEAEEKVLTAQVINPLVEDLRSGKLSIHRL